MPRAVVCVAEAARASHAGFGYSPAKLRVIPNGYLDIPQASPEAKRNVRRELGVPDDAIVVGSVGRFNEYKDHENFVQAMGQVASSVHDAVFLMVGRNVDHANCQLQRWIAQTQSPGQFILLGERSDVARCFAAMDIFCLHSRSEGFPNVLAEAMLAGLPAVATDVGDARLLSAGAVSLVPPQNPFALAEATLALIHTPQAEREAIGKAARERIRTAYSLAAIGEQYLELYRANCAVRIAQ
jgi:glycosyltransferase involved in cell wall biosynthesis